jgi:prepilin-type processing-associated H-X9-DG protein
MRTNPIRVILIAAFVAILFALPAISADDPPPITNKDIETSEDNLKKIGLAALDCHDVRVAMPSNIFPADDEDNTPLLSWRVALLPYLGQKALYDQFKLNEPWDSANNKKLIEKMPKIYEPVRVKAKAGETYYQMFEGKEAVLNSKRKKGGTLTLAVITQFNGTSNTGWVFEAGEPVIWTKPADMPFDKDKPLPKLGGMFDGRFHVLFCDGHVQKFKKDPDEEIMKCIIMWTNTKPFDTSKLDK